MSRSNELAHPAGAVIRQTAVVLLLWATGMLCARPTVHAQDLRVRGGFLSDSLKIGEQTAFYLSARYPAEFTVLFPDSTFSFFPFEYQKKEYFPTRTGDEGISVDSAVYYLTTFEVDRVQSLQLPAFLVQQADCVAVRSGADSVLISQMVAHVPDTLTPDKLPLKMNTAYQKVRFQFNFWMVVLGIAAAGVIAIIIWAFFGSRIAKYFRARKLQRNHEQFLAAYNPYLHELQTGFSARNTESALSAWKKYMEQLEARPYTKLTTKETLRLLRDEKLAANLGSVDNAIYGHNTRVIESLESLKAFAGRRFSEKLREVQHGK